MANTYRSESDHRNYQKADPRGQMSYSIHILHTLCFTRLPLYSNKLFQNKLSVLIKQTKPPPFPLYSKENKRQKNIKLNPAVRTWVTGVVFWHCPVTGLEFTWLRAWVMQLLPIICIIVFFFNFFPFSLYSFLLTNFPL